MVTNTVNCCATYLTELKLNGKSIDKSNFNFKENSTIIIKDGMIGMIFVAMGLMLCLSWIEINK